MSLRKVAGLLVAFGLMVGLLGSGVGAQFFTSVTATENINVGAFGCIISSATHGAIVDPTETSVVYTAPTIMSSQPGSAPFSFTVTSTGDIPVNLHVTATPLSLPFSDILGSVPDVSLNLNQSHTYNAGVSWGVLTTPGASGSLTYTIACNEGPSLSYISHGQNPRDGTLWSQINLAGFPANTSVSLVYTYGSPGWTAPFATITTDGTGTGSFTYPTEENCVDQGLPTPTTWHQDIPVTFTATWGSPAQTLTEVAGTMVCSQL